MRKFILSVYIVLLAYTSVFADSISIIVKPDIVYNGSVVVLNFENLNPEKKYFVEVYAPHKKIYKINDIKRYTTVLIGISLGCKTTAKIFLYENNKIVLEHYLNIKYRVQKKSYLRVKSRYATRRISKKLEERLEAEHKMVQSKKNKILNQRYFYGKPLFPTEKRIISSPFGAIRIFNKKRKSVHYGVDIPGNIGDKIYAVFSGKVSLVSNLYYSGNTVLINSGQGFVLLYAHLSKVYVREDDFVEKGDIIGEVGATGRVTGPHLHLGAYIHNVCIDPMSLFKVLR